MGNFRKGHTNIGPVAVVAMDLGQIDLAIEEGAFAKHSAFARFICDAEKRTGGTAHLMGLV